jgi:hypothetical protein
MLPAAIILTITAFVVLGIRAYQNHLPLSEQCVLSLLHLAAWIQRSAFAWDSAIVRYRIEREGTVVSMESTRRRTEAKRCG